ncbi:MAG: OmpP1/FadL family transporter [Myxococcota bacterium]
MLLLLATFSFATQPDQFGFGGRSMGSGGGGVAMVEDGTAAWLNPGGLSRIRRPTISLGGVYGSERFRDVPDLWWDTNRDGVIDERDPPLDWSVNVEDVAGFQLQVGKQIGGKFGFGLMAWLPAKRLYRLSTIEPDLPNYPFYENRSQRYILAFGFGGEIVKGVNIGVSIDAQSRARFNLYGTLDATITSPDDPDAGLDSIITEVNIDVHEVELDLGYSALPVLGVQLELGRWSDSLDGLVVGASYRPGQAVIVDADLDIQANVTVTDIGDLDPFIIGSVAQADAMLYDHYIPPRLALGVAWRSEDVFSAYVDATYQDWSRARFNVTELVQTDITAPLVELDDTIVDGNDYEAQLRPTWTLRTGVDLKLPEVPLDNNLEYLRFSVRGGFGWIPTPLRAQGQNSAFLDSNRIQATVGAGIEFHDPIKLVDAPVWFDIYGQYHALGNATLPRSTDVPKAGFPVDGNGIPIGGDMVLVGIEWGFEY